MSYTLKKIHAAITALLLIAADQLHADYGHSSISGECRDFYSCAPACCCGKGFISADLLYWRAFEDGLDACFPTEAVDYVSSDGNIISKFKGKGEDPDFNWDAGFRLGTGYQFASGWDIAAFWTHFHSHSSRHHRNNYESRDEHELRWKLDFEVVDLIGAREINLGSCFTLSPFGGLRWARIEQKLRSNFISNADFYSGSSSQIFYSDFSPSGYSSSNFSTFSSHNKEKFWGLGPLVGVELDWNLGCGLSLYANASVAFLYGHFHVRLNESDEFVDGADFCNVKRNMCACQTVLDAGLGVRWQTCFCGSIVWLQLGLEHHSYFNQNRFGDYGDLCLDGANFSAGFAF
ncbi:Lpg1974 family pore-forming outer membrane protein [Candidatus Protochlamydia phocaeensis]|uniref:Lpg1974 family pore-forming outer membrane protein n=1 Tax=Candidatus Protochlamydia phocaeensis TaxID=1414722 RepID=UPI00083851D9|nr:Lpg1974 family pore-forming outer membrane protein [Candidatus Protochlamydia phocaeensis]